MRKKEIIVRKASKLRFGWWWLGHAVILKEA
jgi:hypothetical protein